MRVAYLHGLDSNNLEPKNKWLKSISELYDPLIDYREKNIYQKIKVQIQEFNSDVIIGSSMGGFFAFEIAKELNIKALLFNPALHSRSFEPDMTGHKIGDFNPKMHFVFGKKDSIINPFKTIEMIQSETWSNIDYSIFEHSHDTSFELFKSQIILFL